MTRRALGTWPARLLVGLVLLALTGSARAQAPSDPGEARAYRTAVQAGLAAYEAGDLVRAKEEFERAHALYPNARTLRGLGTVELAMHDYPSAVRHLEQALAGTVLPLAPSLRAQVERALAEANTHVARLRLRAEPREVDLTLDGRRVQADETLVVATGTHVLSAQAPGHQPRTLELTLAPGQVEVVQLALAPAPPAVAAAEPRPEATPRARAEPSRLVRVLPWALLVEGGLSAVVGGALLIRAGRSAQQVEDTPEGQPITAGLRDARERVKPLSRAGGVLLGVGAVSVGAALLWRARLARRTDLHVSLSDVALVQRF